jgi:hypothetical protein
MAALISGGLLACIAVLEETGWIDLDWTSVETQIRHAIAAVHRGLKNSNTSSRGISHQRGQQRLDVLRISGKIARQSQTQGLLTRKITRSPSPLHTDHIRPLGSSSPVRRTGQVGDDVSRFINE